VRKECPILLLFVLAGAGLTLKAAVIVGLPADPSGNCYPFGCVFPPATVYQQVYNSNNFAGPITIAALTFFRTKTDTGADLNTGTYSISLSTTSTAVNGLDITNFGNNVGPDNTLFFIGTLPASVAFGSSFTLIGTPFTYNPANGNLLIDMRISGVAHSGLPTFFDARNGTADGIFSRATDFCSGIPTCNQSYGLVTEFQTSADIPEPGTLTLLITGVLLIGFAAIGMASFTSSPRIVYFCLSRNAL